MLRGLLEAAAVASLTLHVRAAAPAAVATVVLTPRDAAVAGAVLVRGWVRVTLPPV